MSRILIVILIYHRHEAIDLSKFSRYALSFKEIDASTQSVKMFSNFYYALFNHFEITFSDSEPISSVSVSWRRQVDRVHLQ
jgi:hypothetical protein